MSSFICDDGETVLRTGPVLKVRPATLDELDDLSALCFRSKAVWGYDQAFMEACRQELTLTETDLLISQVAVAEVDGTVVGVAQVQIEGREAELHKLFVDPARLRTGAGRALFDWACEAARNYHAICLLIDADPDAAPFYRHMGAKDIGLAPSGSIPGRMLPMLSCEL